jgi:hypothetical protein
MSISSLLSMERRSAAIFFIGSGFARRSSRDLRRVAVSAPDGTAKYRRGGITQLLVYAGNLT